MLNITAAWQASHAHLQPYRNHLALPQNQLHLCPECGGTGACHVVANLLPDKGEWINSVPVLYCPDCGNFLVEPAVLFGAHLGVSSAKIPVVSEVDARCWSPLPTFLNIEPTTRCNFRCWYCIGRHMEQRDIRKEDFAAVLANAPTIRTIALVGEGEPLVHPDFFEMADMAIAQGKKVVIISNGSLLNDANVKKLCESGVSYVSISIDSTDPARFARSRINGNLDDVLRNIKRLRAFRDANGYRYPKIAIKGTLFDYSEGELLDIVKLAREHGAEFFESFQPLNAKQSYVDIYPEENRGQLACLDRVTRAISRDSALAWQLLRPASEFLAEEGIEFGGPGRANGLRPNCDEQYVYALLTGDITPCCQVKQPIDSEWNLFRHPLDAIFQNPQYENMRFNLWNGIFPEYCRGCGKTPPAPLETPVLEATRISASWKVDWATREDEADLLALFARAFGHAMPLEQWRWKYAATEIYGAQVRNSTGQMVSFFGGMPRPILFFGKSDIAVQIGDVMTDSVLGRSLNRQGPFFLAASFYLERFIGPDKAYRLGFGFPSKRHNRLAEHLGLYASVGDVLEAGWSPLRPRPHLSVSVRPLAATQTDLLEPLWQKMAADCKDSILGVRDGAYIRHRFLEHPTTAYLVFLIRRRFSGRPFGLLVLRDHGETGVELLDMVGPRNRLPDLVHIARRITGSLGRQRLFAWLTKPVADNLAATHPRLVPTDVSIPTSIWGIPSEVHRIQDRWWLMGGDADFR
ncbi:MAG: radical SAM protein [Desulfobulbaceae bacterium]|nr:radical SAM protein [Desulfobulbaceae bacterium]HIJ89329.1 radical SAM protein [Deltaproteobacteria bacterium]